VWFGGTASPIVARRIAEIGSGWSPIGNTSADEVKLGVRLIREQCERTGRDPAEITVRVSVPLGRDSSGQPSVRHTLSAAPPFLAAGATIVQLPPLASFIQRRKDVEPALRQACEILQSQAGTAPLPI
jgi:hypothetical protein